MLPSLISPAALVLSPDPLAAALLGAAVELGGFRPVFSQFGETPRESLLRLRPHLVLIDCNHPDAGRDEFLGPALMMGARPLLFGSAERMSGFEPLRERYQLRFIVLPRDVESLREILHGELATRRETLT